MKKELAKFGVVLVVFVYLIVLLTRSWQTDYLAKKNLTRLKDEVAQMGKSRLELERKVDEAKTPAFVEKEARNRLNMGRMDETVLLMPSQIPQVVENKE